MSFVLKNASVVNVFTEEVLQQDVLIEGDTIAGVGSYDHDCIIDCSGKYLVPGFIDAHVHIESSMVRPKEFAKNILQCGTTSIIADPHELVNVAGMNAMEYLLAVAETLAVDMYLMLPSSVPATIFETNGAEFSAEDMAKFVNNPRVLGLGEVMCYPDVLAKQKHILTKIKLLEGKVIDGHAPGLSAQELQEYVRAGVMTDHECTEWSEALEKARAGLKILIREGSGAKNLQSLVTGLLSTDIPCDRFMFCTDDKHISDIQEQGHINYNVQKAIQLGLAPIKAIKMATHNAASTYGLTKVGAIAAGYTADMLLLDSLQDVRIHSVYKKGRLVTPAYLNLLDVTVIDAALLLKNSVRFTDITPDRLQLIVKEQNVIIQTVPYQILTKRIVEKIPSQHGYFTPDATYLKLCVVERHRNTGNVAVAPLKGFGLHNGAIATSVAHDSHNIIAVGDNDTDLCLAINHLKKLGGGYVIVSGGKVLGELSLSIAGLMSEDNAETVIGKIAELLSLAYTMGVSHDIDPFITLSFLALPVIPQIRLTDKGLFNVDTFSMED